MRVITLVAAMRAGDRGAREIVEAMLPAAHGAIRDNYASTPIGPGENDAYRLIHQFDGDRRP